ncbi:unnamed protein product [Rhodiola kirilowii]
MLSLISGRSHGFYSRTKAILFAHFQLYHTKTSRPNSRRNTSIPNPQSSFKLATNPKPSTAGFDHDTVTKTLSTYGNDWNRALEFFEWVEVEYRFRHTAETYNHMIDILGKFFEFRISWDLIRSMSSRSGALCVPNHVTFRIMFKRYVSAHLVREAIDTYDGLGEFNLKDKTSFFNLIDALCEYKHVVEAEELCMGQNRRPEFDSSTKIYNMILRGWFKLGWWSKCREFWEDMDKKGVKKDLHSYSIYMDITCKSGKPWKAIKLYKEMKRKKVPLDVVAYNIAIRAVGLSDGVDSSIGLYREMIDLGCQPNTVTFNTIIKLLCENSRVKDGCNMLEQMCRKGCKPNAITYHRLFGSLEKPNEILKLFDKMIEDGLHPTMDTFVMLIRKFGRWGFLRPVFIIWNKMEERRYSPSEFAYNALIDVLLQKGMVDMAKKYDEEMLKKGLSSKRRPEIETKLADAEYVNGL